MSWWRFTVRWPGGSVVLDLDEANAKAFRDLARQVLGTGPDFIDSPPQGRDVALLFEVPVPALGGAPVHPLGSGGKAEDVRDGRYRR